MKTSIFQNSNENIVRISALKFFVASSGHPGSFLGLPRDLVNTGSPKKTPESPKEAIKTFRAEIFTTFLLPFWKIDLS